MFDWINVYLTSIWDTLARIVQWVTYNLGVMVYNLAQALQYVWNVLVQFGKWVIAGGKIIQSGLIKGIKALLHLNFKAIWGALKRGFDRLRRALAWYQQHVQGPIDRMRRQILEIYRKFFQPIVRFLDSLRVFTRFIALFNRKLAAKLDARLWSLESKLLFPITAALKRINSISSQIRAYFTALGFLDRALLLESLRRDASLVWEVLTNPRARLFAPSAPLGSYTYSDLHNDVQVYAKTRSGPIADYIDEARRSVREDFLEVF